jgi:hypothetical protein
MSGGYIGQRGPTAREETQKEDSMKRLRYPSPALVVAVLALFVSLSGTAVAAGVVPMAKKALFANNAGKLQGKTLGQVAALPSPANKAASLVSVTSTPFSLGVSEERDFTVQCASGAKAISGGYTSPNSRARIRQPSLPRRRRLGDVPRQPLKLGSRSRSRLRGLPQVARTERSSRCRPSQSPSGFAAGAPRRWSRRSQL